MWKTIITIVTIIGTIIMTITWADLPSLLAKERRGDQCLSCGTHPKLLEMPDAGNRWIDILKKHSWMDQEKNVKLCLLYEPGPKLMVLWRTICWQRFIRKISSWYKNCTICALCIIYILLQENWLIWDSVKPRLLLHQSCCSQTQTTKPKLRWPPATLSHLSTPSPTLSTLASLLSTFWPDKLSQPFQKLQTFMNIITIPLCNPRRNSDSAAATKVVVMTNGGLGGRAFL